MIAKTTIMRKLIREAWKCGLLSVSCRMGHIKISGGHWIYLRKEGKLPNKLAAAVIELTGELPEEGCAYTAGPGGNQEGLYDPALFLTGIPQERGQPLFKTALMATHGSKRYRIYQEYAGEIRAVNEIFQEAVEDAAPEDGETKTEGPFKGVGHSIYWENNAELLVAMEVDLDDVLGEVIKDALKEVPIPQ